MLPIGQMQFGRALSSGFHRFNADARHWQILALSGLFCLSLWFSDFAASFAGLAAAISGTMLAQLAGTVWMNWKKHLKEAQTERFSNWLKGFQWKSAMITPLSLAILLRASDPWVWFVAGLIARSKIASGRGVTNWTDAIRARSLFRFSPLQCGRTPLANLGAVRTVLPVSVV